MRWYLMIALAVVAVALIAGVLREDALVGARADARDALREAAEREAAGRYELVLPPGMGFASQTDPRFFTR